MIVKLQRPLQTSTAPLVLIYNRDRSVFFTEPYTWDWHEFFGDDYKLYAGAHMEGSTVVIDRIVSDQNW